jgi:hypothetical protein
MRAFFVLLVLSWAWPAAARAQMFASCSSASVDELRGNIREHAEQTFRMEEKFLDGYYKQGPLPSSYRSPTLEDVQHYLSLLEGRRAAVLYYAHIVGQPRACSWLISADGVAGDVTDSPDAGARDLDWVAERTIAALGLTSRVAMRAPTPRGVRVANAVQAPSNTEVLRQTSRRLFGRAVLAKLDGERIDTLIIVPAADLGSVPFSALPLGGQDLVERLSVWIAPGFGSFHGEPRRATPVLGSAIVEGDPDLKLDKQYVLPPLPGGRAEALAVAELVGVKALVGAAARFDRLAARARASKQPLGLVYLSTHGLADAENPLDGSYLWLADGRRTPREIQNLPLHAGQPLVVLSACQTGLGKVFPVGSIGMARGWQRAGASSVVMSLWRVDDVATQALMTEFLRAALDRPPDKALQHAMLVTRATHPDPAQWASFTVFGVPGR